MKIVYRLGKPKLKVFENDEELEQYAIENHISRKNRFYFMMEGIDHIYKSIDDYLFEG